MTTDPTITIAGLEARIGVLSEALRLANRGRADLSTDASKLEARLGAMEAERDALAAQLAEVRAQLHEARHVGTDLGVANDLCASLRADLASERAHLAACRTRIAGLEQAANERSAEVARMTARVAELEARPVLTEERLRGALFACADGASDAEVRAILAALGRVTLPAQDRAEDLTQAIHGTPREEVNPAMWRGMVERTRSALASLGAPPTSPPAAIDADALYARCERDFMGGYTGQMYDAFKHGMWTVCNVLRSTAPTSSPAARPVFAEVSEDELIRLFYVVGTDGIDHGEQCPPIDSSDRNGIRAVLARLEVSLVAEADPEAVARDYANNAATGYAPGIDHPPYWFEYTDEQRTKRTAAMRATLTARGIPVTPEVGK